ncbi:MAG: sigma-70 family RNA polymerase sigma factor [Planctomycetota bacterium]|nr:sigma-70 family RNA polymerase sigma factor [Planctomycetota bacterium]
MVEARLFGTKSAPELLEEFRATGAQAPFEEIVRRYAGMVFSVCLRVTKNNHDAEDATQAVFLALAVQGKTAKPIRYIGPWLQQVAHRLSLDIRRSKKRQKAREEKVGEMMRSSNGTNGNGNGHSGNGNGKHAPDAVYEQDELKRLINDEINQLPSKYRLPLILHYFGGLTREEMAKELNVRPNTLGVRVYRGRELLGKRLAQRGLSINTGALSLMLAGSISLRFNESLITSTCSAAVAAATGGVGGGPEVIASVFANQVLGISRTIMRGMALANIKVVAALAIAIGTAVTGAAEIVSRVTPLDLRFSLPTDLASRLRDTLRSFIRPLHFSSANTTSADEILDAAAMDDDDSSIRFAGNWQLVDPLAQRDLGAAVHVPAIQVAGGAITTTESDLVSALIESSTVQQRQVTVVQESSVSSGHAVAGAVPLAGASPTAGSGLPKVNSPIGTSITSARAAAPPRVIPNVTPPTIVLGARPGVRDTRVVRAGESHHYERLTVGDRGSATFRQTGGSTRIDADLTIGRTRGSSGEVELAGGTMSTGGNQIVGLAGKGRFTQTGGANVIDGSLLVGHEGFGTYAMRGGTLTADKLKVAFTGEGHFTQGYSREELATAIGVTTSAFDPTSRFNDVIVADRQGSVGTITLNGGSLSSNSQTIGRAGDGTIVQDGGTNTANSVSLGSARQSIGSYVLNDGVLVLDPDAYQIDGDAGITIGGAGSGSFRMGAANRAARIEETETGTNLAIRAKASGTGLFEGWGGVGLTGLVVNNGKIIANGYGQQHALILSTATGVTNTIENPTLLGTNGWFATDGGQLVLPPLHVAPGSNAYSWGEDPNDALPDLVNSVRLYVRDAAGEGDIDISLLALGRPDIPTLPGGHNFIGVWSFDAHDLEFTGVDLAVRYDDALAQERGLSESILKLWKYENGAWVRIDDDSFRRYAALNVISGFAGADLTYFAVSAPEPTSLGALALGGWMLMRRRRRD